MAGIGRITKEDAQQTVKDGGYSGNLDELSKRLLCLKYTIRRVVNIFKRLEDKLAENHANQDPKAAGTTEGKITLFLQDAAVVVTSVAKAAFLFLRFIPGVAVPSLDIKKTKVQPTGAL